MCNLDEFDSAQEQWRTQEYFSGVFNKFSWGQTERGSGGGSPLVRGSGDSCNLVQEILSHIVIFLIFGNLRLFMMTTNLFVIANVNKLLTGGSFRNFTAFFENLGALDS